MRPSTSFSKRGGPQKRLASPTLSPSGTRNASAAAPAPDELVRVGLLLRPHGLGGELLTLPLTDDPQRFRLLDAAYVEPPQPKTSLRAGSSSAGAACVAIAGVRFHKGRPIVKIAGCDDAESAQAYKGRYLSVTRDMLMPLDENTYYVFDLIGCAVVAPDGSALGELRDVMETGASDVYVIDGPGGELLLPAIRQVVLSVDVRRKRIVADPSRMSTIGEADAECSADGTRNASAAGRSGAEPCVAGAKRNAGLAHPARATPESCETCQTRDMPNR